MFGDPKNDLTGVVEIKDFHIKYNICIKYNILS